MSSHRARRGLLVVGTISSPEVLTVLAEILPEARALLLDRPDLLDTRAAAERGLTRVFDAAEALGLFPASRELLRGAVAAGQVGMVERLSELLPADEADLFENTESDREGDDQLHVVALKKGDLPMLRWMVEKSRGFLADSGDFAASIAEHASTPEVAKELFAQLKPSSRAMAETLLVPRIYGNGLFEWIAEHYAFGPDFCRRFSWLAGDLVKKIVPWHLKAAVWLVDCQGMSREDFYRYDSKWVSHVLGGQDPLVLQYVVDRLGLPLRDLAAGVTQPGRG